MCFSNSGLYAQQKNPNKSTTTTTAIKIEEELIAKGVGGERERERKKEKRRGLKWPGAKWLFSVVSIDFGAPVGLATAAGR